MPRRTLPLVVLVTAALGLSACGDQDDGRRPPAVPAGAGALQGPAPRAGLQGGDLPTGATLTGAPARALARVGDKVYAAGVQWVATLRGSALAFSARSGELAQAFGTNGEVTDVLPDGRGGVFLAGSFDRVGARRRSALEELVCGKAVDLLSDSCGLTTEDVERLETIVTELEKPAAEEPPDPGDVEECNYLRKMLEKIAREDGLELDLSDVDPTMHPADFEQEIERRFQAAAAAGTDFGPPLRPRKQTKAQLEKQRKLEEQEAAKKCDFKSLYKQLAKALHPDLEPDPLLKQHKEVWMKRLTGAYAAGDLRELLQIEMEWLGEEATNLATASEGKLQVYCAVLKQQIADLKQQTGYLLREPQYGTLRRFIDPFFGTMLSTAEIISDLRKELRRHRSMVKALTDGEPHRRKMMEQWADDHRQSLRQPTFHF